MSLYKAPLAKNCVLLTDVCGEPALCSHPHHQCHMIDATAMCMCPMIIPKNLDPVCGSDGETYPNAAALKSLSCLANRIVEVQHRGACVGRELKLFSFM